MKDAEAKISEAARNDGVLDSGLCLSELSCSGEALASSSSAPTTRAEGKDKAERNDGVLDSGLYLSEPSCRGIAMASSSSAPTTRTEQDGKKEGKDMNT